MMRNPGSQFLCWSHRGWWEPAPVPSPRPPRGKCREEHPAGLSGSPSLCGTDPAALHCCIPPTTPLAPAAAGSQRLSCSAPVLWVSPVQGRGRGTARGCTSPCLVQEVAEEGFVFPAVG